MEGWVTKPINDVITKTPTVDPRKSPSEKFRYVDVSGVSNKTLKITEANELLGSEAPSRARKVISDGNVIFATVRPTLKRIAVVPNYLNGEVCSTGYFVFQPNEELHNRYLFYFLQSDFFMGEMERLQAGASYPAVNDTQVKSTLISYPSIPEQKRIVAILDQAFADIEQARAKTEQNLKNARELFESYLQQVFSQRGEGWESYKLGAVCELISGQHIDAKNYNNEQKGIGYLTGPSDFGTINPIVTKWTEHPKRTAIKGDILITVKGSGVGKVNVMSGSELAISRQLMAVRPTHAVGDLLYWFLSMQFDYFQSLANGAAIPGISRHDVLDLKLSIPMLKNQQELVDRISTFNLKTVDLERIYKEKLSSLDELTKSILQKAFSGELTKEKEGAVA